MSLATWKKEFYPSEASTIQTSLGAVKHSIRKWTGLLPENLKKHGVVRAEFCNLKTEDDDSDTRFTIASETCALCCIAPDDCVGCPLEIALGHACSGHAGGGRPYQKWYWENKPRPMLDGLKKALRMIEQGKIPKK